jgi:type II secretory pathway predicted ATPase ExeA
MALILVGHSELWDLLKRQINTAVRQHLDIRCGLYHYDRPYFRRHLDHAGSSQNIFSDAAVSEIFLYSAGHCQTDQQSLLHTV